jgi:hypothetical protein
LDALSWIGLTVIAIMALAVAAVWLREKLVRHGYGGWGPLGGLLLACVLLLAVEGFANVGLKEAVFDDGIDVVVDAIDGTDDREEWIARHREDGGHGFLLAA